MGLTASLRRRGVTLIEAVLYVAVALALIVGGLVFFQQASLASRVNAAVRSLSALTAEIRVIARDTGVMTMHAGEMENVLLAQGSLPMTNVDMTRPAGERIRHGWSGHIAASLQDQGWRALVMLGVFSFPVAACSRLVWIDASGEGEFSTGVEVVHVSDDGGGTATFVLPGGTRTAAGNACRNRDSDGDGMVTALFFLRVSD